MIQEAREIIITIKSDGTAGSKKKTPELDKKEKKEKQEKSRYVVASVYANQAFNYAKQAVISQARFQVNRYFAMTDDYQGKQDIDNALSLLGTGMTIWGATMAGLRLGGIAGGVIGLVGSTGNTILQAHRAVSTQDYQIRQSNAQLSYTMSRRGASLQNNSIGENL